MLHNIITCEMKLVTPKRQEAIFERIWTMFFFLTPPSAPSPSCSLKAMRRHFAWKLTIWLIRWWIHKSYRSKYQKQWVKIKVRILCYKWCNFAVALYSPQLIDVRQIADADPVLENVGVQDLDQGSAVKEKSVRIRKASQDRQRRNDHVVVSLHCTGMFRHRGSSTLPHCSTRLCRQPDRSQRIS